MREKLLDLMKSEGLKSSQLADMLGVNPAGISHILAGRNKPGFDLLQKILRRFPRINPDWLLLDTGPMYRDAEGAGIVVDKNPESASPTQNAADTAGGLGGLFAPNGTDRAAAVSASTAPEDRRTPQPEPIAMPSANRNAAVKRIVVLHEDGTFESYLPTTL